MIAAHCLEPPLVLLPGWGSTPRVFDALCAALPVQAPVIPLSFPDPSGWPDPADPARWLDWLEGALPPRATLLGWSLGGALALLLAARRPEQVCAVVAIGTNPRFCASTDWDCGMPPAAFDAFRQSLQQDPAAHLQRFALLQARGDAGARAVARSLRDSQSPATDAVALQHALELLARIDLRAELGAIRAPVLHLLGEHDALVPAAVAAYYRRLQPAASVYVAAGTGHAPFLSRPQAVAARIGDFLGAVDPAPRGRDKRAVARSFGRAAPAYASGAALQRDCGERLLALAPPVPARRVLDLGCGTGAFLPALRVRFPEATTVAADIAEGMLHHAGGAAPDCLRACADAERLPFAEATFDLVFSNLALQWCEQLPQLYREIARVLRPGGVALVSTLGPDTLWELRAAWRAHDAAAHVNRFPPEAALRVAIADAGLALARFDREDRVERHATARDVARGLKRIGARNVDPGRPAGLSGRSAWSELEQAYATLADGGEGLPATWQLWRLVLRRPHG